MVLISRFLVPKGYNGLTVFPFIFLKFKTLKHNRVLINHEKIHLRQQLEMFIIPFFVFYTIEFLLRFIAYKNWHDAYKNISFEREAYVNECNLDYLKNRLLWHFIKYI